MREQGILGTAVEILNVLHNPTAVHGGRSDVGNRQRFVAAVNKVLSKSFYVDDND
jgi:hypothetical protein